MGELVGGEFVYKLYFYYIIILVIVFIFRVYPSKTGVHETTCFNAIG